MIVQLFYAGKLELMEDSNPVDIDGTVKLEYESTDEIDIEKIREGIVEKLREKATRVRIVKLTFTSLNVLTTISPKE